MIKYTIEKFDKIESKAGKIAALCVSTPIIAGAFYWIVCKIISIVIGLSILVNIAELEKEIRSNMIMITNVQGVSLDGLKAEMETEIIYDVEVQKTNGGDYWIFKDEIVYTNKEGYSQKIKVVYSAHVRHKEKKVGYFDFNNKHHWIKKKNEQ
jgi:hypothetical protein